MLKKVSLAVAAVFACAGSAHAGWDIHGYGRLGGQWDGHLNNNMTTFGKNEYRTVTSNDENNNQVEVTVKKSDKYKGGAFSNFVLRAEYGNQNAGDESAFYSSQGSEHSGAQSGQFEVKEAYVEMGGLSYLGADTKIWAGQRFLNRAQAVLSKEFWKQSSGVGFGFENGKFGAAIVSADPGNTTGSNVKEKANGQTLTSLDLWYSGLEVPGGNLQFDVKFMNRAHTEEDCGSDTCMNNASSGVGGSVTYNTNWYGVKGWTQNVIAYGSGLATNRGVNFGSWSEGYGKDSKGLFFTSYGVADLTDSVQLASEVTYWAPQNVWDQKKVTRWIAALQPSIKLNDFARVIVTGSVAEEKVDSPQSWGFSEETNADLGAATDCNNWGSNITTGCTDSYKYYALEAAVAFTANSDYFGRPQIKPFVSYVAGDSKGAAKRANVSNGDKAEITWGVEAEIWW